MAAIVAIEAQMIETLTKFRTWEWMTLRSGYCNNNFLSIAYGVHKSIARKVVYFEGCIEL